MPSLLICIQTVSFTYRQASSAYAQWDSQHIPRCPSWTLLPQSQHACQGRGPCPCRPSGSGAFCFPKAAHARWLLSHILVVASALLSFPAPRSSSSHLLGPAKLLHQEPPSSQEATRGGRGLARHSAPPMHRTPTPRALGGPKGCCWDPNTSRRTRATSFS